MKVALIPILKLKDRGIIIVYSNEWMGKDQFKSFIKQLSQFSVDDGAWYSGRVKIGKEILVSEFRLWVDSEKIAEFKKKVNFPVIQLKDDAFAMTDVEKQKNYIFSKKIKRRR